MTDGSVYSARMLFPDPMQGPVLSGQLRYQLVEANSDLQLDSSTGEPVPVIAQCSLFRNARYCATVGCHWLGFGSSL